MALPKVVTKKERGRPIGTKKVSKAEQVRRGSNDRELPQVADVTSLRRLKSTATNKSLSNRKAKKKKNV